MHNRIQRSAQWADFMQEEASRGLTYGRVSGTKRSGHDIVLKYRISRWESLSDGNGEVKLRELFCWIHLDGKPVGALEMNEIDASDVDSEDLVFVMDQIDHYAYEFATVIRRGWPELMDITSYGTILDFKRVWIEPAHSRSGLWVEAAKLLINSEFRRHAVMIMKAFPLEYEGKGSPDYAAALASRQRAMVRHYGALFGVRPFPAKDGRNGWLWRFHRRIAKDAIVEPAPLSSSE